MGEAIKAGTNTPRPYHKKNRAVHQAAIVLGIIISHSPSEICSAAPRACYLMKHMDAAYVAQVGYSSAEEIKGIYRRGIGKKIICPASALTYSTAFHTALDKPGTHSGAGGPVA